MSLRRGLIFVLALSSSSSVCQTAPGTIPAGTPLALAIDRNYPMRKGEPISAHLLYPIYADNQLLLPKDTIVTGSVIDLHSDRQRRNQWHAHLSSDRAARGQGRVPAPRVRLRPERRARRPRLLHHAGQGRPFPAIRLRPHSLPPAAHRKRHLMDH
jgi:hypothetical protein